MFFGHCVFRCQYKCNRLPAITRLRSDLSCARWVVKLYSPVNSPFHARSLPHCNITITYSSQLRDVLWALVEVVASACTPVLLPKICIDSYNAVLTDYVQCWTCMLLCFLPETCQPRLLCQFFSWICLSLVGGHICHGSVLLLLWGTCSHFDRHSSWAVCQNCFVVDTGLTWHVVLPQNVFMLS